MQTVTAEWLKSTELLKEVPLDQLQWMIDNSQHLSMEEGETFFKTGDPIKGAYIVVSGRIRLYMMQAREMREVAVFEPGDISGFLPFSRGTTTTVNAQVLEKTTVMLLPVEKFREMISRFYELTAALVHVMTNRVRNYTSLQQQNEKMMALGKLSAGLAHELNNPAAAIVRGSESLVKHLKLEPDLFKDVINVKMEAADVDFVTGKLFEILQRKDKPKLTLIQKTELEDELRDWLDENQVENSDEIAENFLEYGFTCDDMEQFEAHIPDKYISPVLNWINTNLVTERMVQDIQEASQRIFTLIQSVKNFTHMDQGKGKELVDVHTGIVNTLTMMQYKLKKANIEVIQEFDSSLPRIMALVGELNQVWTNLIDNAVDAMEANGKGKLTIHTERDREFAKISIIDNGPGIPEDIKNRIFDPFFTTKGIGKGTGLGLDMVCRIVQNQHNGTVKVESVPGRTEFVVCLPIAG